MFKLDDDFLKDLGLGALPAEEKKKMLSHIYETLEMNVGMKLASGMSDAQLDEFESLMPTPEDSPEEQARKEQAALKWLEANFPNYKQVVAEELEKLKHEVRTAAPHILAEAGKAHPAQ